MHQVSWLPKLLKEENQTQSGTEHLLKGGSNPPQVAFTVGSQARSIPSNPRTPISGGGFARKCGCACGSRRTYYPMTSMTEEEVVSTIRAHLEGQFPKVCANCERCYPTFRNYLQNTSRLGSAMSYDAELGNWEPVKPLGAITHSNCPCGSTLALSSAGMPLLQLWSLLNWARVETKKRNQTTEALLNYLREVVCKQVLADP